MWAYTMETMSMNGDKDKWGNEQKSGRFFMREFMRRIGETVVFISCALSLLLLVAEPVGRPSERKENKIYVRDRQ